MTSGFFQNAGFLTLLALSSFVAYFQNIGNFLVTEYTSPLTLQVKTQIKINITQYFGFSSFCNL